MAMSMLNQKKLIAAGFVLFRLNLKGKRIKSTHFSGCWRTYGKYRTQKECKVKWDFLMMNDKYIEG